jgi:hypothetical protein
MAHDGLDLLHSRLNGCILVVAEHWKVSILIDLARNHGAFRI